MIKLFLIKVNKIIVRDIALSCLVAVISDHSLVTSIPYRLVILLPFPGIAVLGSWEGNRLKENFLWWSSAGWLAEISLAHTIATCLWLGGGQLRVLESSFCAKVQAIKVMNRASVSSLWLHRCECGLNHKMSNNNKLCRFLLSQRRIKFKHQETSLHPQSNYVGPLHYQLVAPGPHSQDICV